MLIGLMIDISIHAPAKGATVYTMQKLSYTTISIHAPAKGATKAVLYYLILLGYFNPRSREGSDYVKEWLVCVIR